MPGGLAPDIDGQNQAIAVPLFTGGLIKDARHGHHADRATGSLVWADAESRRRASLPRRLAKYARQSR